MFSSGVKFFYKTILPVNPGDFFTELDTCIRKIKEIETQSSSTLFKLAIFHDPSDEDEETMRKRDTGELLQNNFPLRCPAYSLLSQKPVSPWKVSIEAAFIAGNACQIYFRNLDKIPYVVFECAHFKELWAAGISANSVSLQYQKKAIAAFEMIHTLLAKEDMDFNDIVRQWNYLGGITRENKVNEAITSNYQIFNEIRHKFYNTYRKAEIFPAATGIGTKFSQVSMDICAIRTAVNNCKTIAIHNPNQVDAHQYDQQVLEGVPLHSQTKKHPPEFERAVLFTSPDHSRLFISGTASIIGQQTIGVGDIRKQTLTTIANIEQLTQISQLRKCYPLLPQGSFHYSFLRVYVKNQQDLETVIATCNRRFAGIPVSYVVADVCRDDLLMEIEGEMLFNASGDFS